MRASLHSQIYVMQVTEHFTEKELSCAHCKALPTWIGEFARHLEDLRAEVMMPLPITSAYRCEDHPIEITKRYPGEHHYGAVDISIYKPVDVQRLVCVAITSGEWPGIGIKQRGPIEGRFVHLDRRSRPGLWTY